MSDDAGLTHRLAAFQQTAVERARTVLARFGGVIVADSVGLGKTYIGLALAEESLRRGESVLVTTPASLRAQWSAPLRRIADVAGARRRIGLGRATETRAVPASAPALMWVSHARLSRGTQPSFSNGPQLCIVDEAHAFRNARTRRYRELARMCTGARLVLLTATPVNNGLLDLYHLIRLFAGDGAFAALGVHDLRVAFRAAALDPDSPPDGALRDVLRVIMVRRTRSSVRNLPDDSGAARFPERAPPHAVRYDLAAAYPALYDDLAACLEELRLAPFRTGAYGLGKGSASGAAELVALGLLKRLESSVAAFLASATALRDYLREFLEHLGRGLLLSPADHRGLRGPARDGALQLLLEHVVLRPLPRCALAAELDAAVRRDLLQLERITDRLRRAMPAGEDPKLAALVELLEGRLAGERVIVFTEFRTTALALWRALLPIGGVALVHGGGARLGSAPWTREAVLLRFAPRANGAREPPAAEAVRVLVATDVLSEGLNLQDARHVVSYDLPWNPVRLIQRIGRIDRLGSPHDTVHLHTFLPDHGLEHLLGILDRLRRKLRAIRVGVGEEDAVLEDGDAARLPSVLERLAAGDPHLLDEIERADDAAFGTGEATEAAGNAHPPNARAPAGARVAADRLLAALALVPGGPEPALCARVEHTLLLLRNGLPAGPEAELRSRLAALPSARRPNRPHTATAVERDLLLICDAVERWAERPGVHERRTPPASWRR